MLSSLRAQAASLQRSIEALEERLEVKKVTPGELPPVQSRHAARMPKGRNFELVRDYLTQHGRSGVTQIAQGVGISKTSVSSVVHSHKTVFSGVDGKWDLSNPSPRDDWA